MEKGLEFLHRHLLDPMHRKPVAHAVHVCVQLKSRYEVELPVARGIQGIGPVIIVRSITALYQSADQDRIVLRQFHPLGHALLC